MTGKTDNRYRIPREARIRMLEQYASGMPTDDIAASFGVEADYVRKAASREGVRKGYPMPAPEAPPAAPEPCNDHLVAYRRAQRGFYVPPALEPAYTELLVGGLSRRAAAVRLGLHRE